LGSISHMILFDLTTTGSAVVQFPDTAYQAGATWDSARGRWILLGQQYGGGSPGGIYTASADGSSVAKRLAIAVGPYSFIFQLGTRAVVRNGAGSWHTSDDGGINWSTRVGPTSTNNGYVAGGRLVVSGSSSGFLIDAGGLLSASFASAATTTFGNPDVQWQLSTDGGATWTNITDATSPTLSLTPVSADSGKRYRAVYTKASYTTVNSTSATLTVP
jgi:hypothetical protein